MVRMDGHFLCLCRRCRGFTITMDKNIYQSIKNMRVSLNIKNKVYIFFRRCLDFFQSRYI